MRNLRAAIIINYVIIKQIFQKYAFTPFDEPIYKIIKL